jgi:hypothetical protein
MRWPRLEPICADARPARAARGGRRAFYARHQGIAVSAEQVIVTSGATEAIAASLIALIEPGDEVVLFQPLYDAYLPLVRRAGGVPRFVRLTPPDWRITREALAEAFTDRTRLVVFNNPHNPTARMFGSEELALLAEACVASDALRPHRRGVGACRVRRPPPRPALDLAGHGRADGQGGFGRQDLLADRLEGRLGAGAAGPRRGGRQGAPVRHLLDRAQPAGRGPLTASASRPAISIEPALTSRWRATG